MPGQSDGYNTTKRQREEEGLDLKSGVERWAGRSFLATGYREPYVAPTGLRPEH